VKEVRIECIPQCLSGLDQWVLWKVASRNDGSKPTKLPFHPDGSMAKANDPSTWSTFAAAVERYRSGGYDGIGFEFSADDPYCGIDLDGCRDSGTGKVADWAREIILKFGSYAEVSPSDTGIKIFCCGRLPFATGRKVAVKADKLCDKEPAIEVYDHARFFAVTGWRLACPHEPQEAQQAIDWLKSRYWPDDATRPATPTDFHSDDAAFERARKYLAKVPESVSGAGGHNACFHAACVLVIGFELGEQDSLNLLNEYNARCKPAWSERELKHKVAQAMKQGGKRGYLRNAAPGNWTRIPVPAYECPAQPNEHRQTTLVDAARSYIESLTKDGNRLVTLGIADLDQAIGGGVEQGEFIIFAARPSHGKSAVAMQCCHVWTEMDMPCAIVSEEMSSLMLGKRTLQFTSRVHQEHWFHNADRLRKDVDDYAAIHKPCYVLEGCGTVEAACKAIERTVVDHGVRCAVVDYAQLLRANGANRYEQISNTSIALRSLATRLKIVLVVLCQLNRAVEKRGAEFMPIMSDLRDSGQLEQDADVICFLCWPWRMDSQRNRDEYLVFVNKNRNRPINEGIVKCRFSPDRQQITDVPVAESHPVPGM
jgi:hypothetical protein